jgi:phenylalanyl-tRNA synthetase beta chain
MTTLDGKERTLDPDDLLVCDRDKGQVIAGVMGGADSEVSDATTRVLLECAYFRPAGVRRSGKRHALHTESSHRFERGVDELAVPAVLDRAAALIAELAGGKVRAGRVDVHPNPSKPREVTLRVARVGRVLGVEIPGAEIERILTALGFEAVEKKDGAIRYRVPTFRQDVEREEDLIEEVARIRGYESIPSTLPASAQQLKAVPPAIEAERRARSALAGAGFDEVVNYSFVSPKEQPWVAVRPLEQLGKPVTAIPLKNPLSVEQSVMRTTLFQSLLDNLSRNLRHQEDSVRLYEIGRSYLPDPEGGQGQRPAAVERLELAGVVWGKRSARTWTAKDERADFFDAKGAVESVLGAVHAKDVVFRPGESAPFHPRATAEIRTRDHKHHLGWVGELHPKAGKLLGLPEGVFLFTLDWAALTEQAELVPAYQGLSRFPATFRDLAVLVDAGLRNEEVRQIILEVGQPLVEDAVVFDVYAGAPIPEGKKNLAYALSYRAKDRTLTDAEVNEAHTRIVAEVNKRLGAELRA